MVRTTLVLIGPLAGKTVRLQHHQFVNGELTLESKSGPDHEGAIRYLGRCYQAVVKGSEAHKKWQSIHGVQRDIQKAAGPGNTTGVSGRVDGSAGPVQAPDSVPGSGHDSSGTPSGAASLVPGGSGHENSGLLPEQVAAIRRAIAALDPAVNAHWNEEGKPSIEVMAAATGLAGMSRQMIDAVAPDVTRESASEI